MTQASCIAIHTLPLHLADRFVALRDFNTVEKEDDL